MSRAVPLPLVPRWSMTRQKRLADLRRHSRHSRFCLLFVSTQYRHDGKEGGRNFGLLTLPADYWYPARRTRRLARLRSTRTFARSTHALSSTRGSPERVAEKV